MRRFVIGLFTVVVLGTLFVVLCTFVRRPYEKVVLDRFGNLIEEKDQSHIAYNWYMKWPTDGVVRIDTRLHLYTGPLQQVATAKKEPISIRTFAAWHIVDPVKFYKTTGGSDQRARDIMDQKLRGLVQAKLAAHALDDFFNTDEKMVHTEEVEQQVAQEATQGSLDSATGERQSGLKDQGLEIVDVGFSRMAFPPTNAEAVYSAMVASLNAEAMKFDADGRAIVTQKQAEAMAEANRIRSEAIAQADAIKGKGDADAAKILADAQAEPGAQRFYQYWKSLDFWKNAMSKNTYLVLSTDNPVLRGLFEPPTEQGAATQPARPSPLMPPMPETK
jgi:membrane protease subunit HflC